MDKKTDVEVIINNKKYVICGYESPDYLEQIALYINKKLLALKSEDWYNRLDTDLKNVLLITFFRALVVRTRSAFFLLSRAPAVIAIKTAAAVTTLTIETDSQYLSVSRITIGNRIISSTLE